MNVSVSHNIILSQPGHIVDLENSYSTGRYETSAFLLVEARFGA
jgi:hypothetical protein